RPDPCVAGRSVVSTADLTLDVDLPPDFQQVPVSASVEDRVFEQSRIIDRLRLTEPLQREGLGWYLEALSRTMAAASVAGSAFCAVRIGTTASAATVTLAVHPAPSDDPLVFALGACGVFRRSGGYETIRHERIGGTLAALGSGVTNRVRHLAIARGVVGHNTGVVLRMATTDLRRAPLYEQIARDAAESVRIAG